MNYLDLSPEYIARVTTILTRPMTALEFADLFWPERKHRTSAQRSQGGHALLNALVRKGLIKRVKNKQGPDTFIFSAHAQREGRTTKVVQETNTDRACYWVLIWRENDKWGWLCEGCEGKDWKTQQPGKRLRYTVRAAAMAALWLFRLDTPDRGKDVRLVRVTAGVS
jgi:hypothetical protein